MRTSVFVFVLQNVIAPLPLIALPPNALPVAFLTTAGAFATLLGVDVCRRLTWSRGGGADVTASTGCTVMTGHAHSRIDGSN